MVYNNNLSSHNLVCEVPLCLSHDAVCHRRSAQTDVRVFQVLYSAHWVWCWQATGLMVFLTAYPLRSVSIYRLSWLLHWGSGGWARGLHRHWLTIAVSVSAWHDWRCRKAFEVYLNCVEIAPFPAAIFDRYYGLGWLLTASFTPLVLKKTSSPRPWDLPR